jgi:hypothetical protein
MVLGCSLVSNDLYANTYSQLTRISGTEYIDQVTLAPGLVIHKQSIGVASNSTGFQGIDGILG